MLKLEALGPDDAFSWYSFVKYLTYSLLFLNVLLFFMEEYAALEHTFIENLSALQFIQVFSATTDTVSWFLLLLLFEIETSVLDLRNQSRKIKSSIFLFRGLCYGAICYAFLGYYYELLTIYDVTLVSKIDVCPISSNWSLLVDVDEYISLEPENCTLLPSVLGQISSFKIIAPMDTLASVQYLTLVDLINAGAWILVVAVLELELQLLQKEDTSKIVINSVFLLKAILYLVLFSAAIYWGFAGDFLDFWDASLWLFAFIFIELNIFKKKEPKDLFQ